MPSYTYLCKKCGFEFSQHQKITEDPLKCCCPKCGGPVERKIGTGAGLVFKGDGFYITDYKKKENQKSDKK